MQNILVTGGAGYIGSHTVLELLNAGYSVTVIDNLSNSSEESLKRVEKLTDKKVKFYEGDIRDKALLDKIFSENKTEGVIHFAGLKAVGESCRIPLDYYENNVYGTLVLLDSMKRAGVKKIIFSSSATVYGVPERLPLTEDCRLSVTNPYGATKLMIEHILQDLQAADGDWNIMLLRYFNPVGAHESGLIGEDPKGIPNNLMPFIAQVASGIREKLRVFGNDYPTRDGTGVRDYIHVVDLAKGHVAALAGYKCEGVHICNLGTGTGYSVLEMVHAFERACGKKIPYEIVERRSGDVAECYASAEKAKKDLGWSAKLGIDEMCTDTWRWQKNNP
ncbi:MAG: UDP-glucose 4-epimerase GalE, partial [Clostridia bacterium]|nr:UDP-glucose 4-epimerase GalE [Clostridia bacterium]